MVHNHIEGSYNWFLVCLSFIIALFASYTALNLARRVLLSEGWKKRGWLFGGAVVMGVGIWSMHFIAMLAVHLPTGVTYDFVTVLVSIGVSIVGAFIGFGIASHSGRGTLRLIVGGTIMGLAITGMHYIGMYALTGLTVTYNPYIFSLSILIAVLASIVALLFSFRRNNHYWLSGFIMGIAVTGMHYTGMSAATMSMPVHMLSRVTDAQAMDFIEMAVYVAFGTIVIMAVSLIGSMNVDKKLSEQLSLKGSILESAIDCLIMFDHKGTIFEFNPAAETLFGYSRSEAIGRSIEELLMPEQPRDMSSMNGMLCSGDKKVLGTRVETMLPRGNQCSFPAEIIVTRIRSEKFPVFTMYLRDLTERRLVEEALRESEERYRKLIDFSPEPILVHYQGVISFVNESALRIFGAEQDGLIGRGFLELVHSECFASAAQWLEHIQTGTSKGDPIELKMHKLNGTTIDIEAKSILVHFAGQALIQTIAWDITDKKRYENTIRQLAYYDMLTGLPNRNWFNLSYPELLQVVSAGGQQAALMFLDLDRFKLINDTMGHLMGDRLLQHFAAVLSETIGDNRMVARLSGDEFVAIIQDCDRSQLELMAETLIRRVAEPIQVEGQDIFITTSVGIALYPEDGETLEMLLQNADTAMYAAKEKGKNQFQFFEWSMNHRQARRMNIEQALPAAIEEQAFHLVYQPMFNAEQGQLIGVETLARWEHPVLGTISPCEFIPIAESTGHIIVLGEWILHKACKQMKEWHDAGLPRIPVAVNFSVIQFNQDQIVDMIIGVLEQTGLEAKYLAVEMTESMAMQHNVAIVGKLHALKQLGVSISIDDFGTGYSSLCYLRRFPIDTLKIDKSFVQDVSGAGEDTAIVEAIIAMARSLKLRVLAEGVETEQQSERLCQLGCTDMQGYWHSRPLSIRQFEQTYLSAAYLARAEAAAASG
ncbi:EAL domain-containing protein [Paenibacillus sp. BC26]|uniref:EAL domain-containing protein n=1 Tax=Paenibacillus sp. BC26 TaxID=1881032 RepID=UPI0008E858E5|nr:EAL domain-containing protein [Paenibacillus sp. BC26]SFS53709.1 PAS domain S-box-containing protein/diguanylate cyclase (GGDEF) domain-containing protein [Paenibacillus sp. BC26]